MREFVCPAGVVCSPTPLYEDPCNAERIHIIDVEVLGQWTPLWTGECSMDRFKQSGTIDRPY